MLLEGGWNRKSYTDTGRTCTQTLHTSNLSCGPNLELWSKRTTKGKILCLVDSLSLSLKWMYHTPSCGLFLYLKCWFLQSFAFTHTLAMLEFYALQIKHGMDVVRSTQILTRCCSVRQTIVSTHLATKSSLICYHFTVRLTVFTWKIRSQMLPFFFFNRKKFNCTNGTLLENNIVALCLLHKEPLGL